MRMIFKRLAAYFMAGAITVTSLSVPMIANADYYGSNNADPTGGEMMADAFLVRPFMVASSLLTTATFIVTLPFTVLGGNVGESATKLVKEPLAYTYVRPLGEM